MCVCVRIGRIAGENLPRQGWHFRCLLESARGQAGRVVLGQHCRRAGLPDVSHTGLSPILVLFCVLFFFSCGGGVCGCVRGSPPPDALVWRCFLSLVPFYVLLSRVASLVLYVGFEHKRGERAIVLESPVW